MKKSVKFLDTRSCLRRAGGDLFRFDDKVSAFAGKARWVVFAFIILTFIPKSFAQDRPELLFPVACTLDADCWVVNYPDVDPAEDSAADYRCNAKTYDGHKGTDFAVRSMAEVERGVDVLAVASGRVLRARDGESDSLKSEDELDAIREAQRECGNAVLIDHGAALSSLYCHLKNGSVSVKPGDEVRAGQKIGQIGHSGLAEFPHVHVGITWEGGIVDPATSAPLDQGCAQAGDNLWEPDLTYSPFSLYDGGFRTDVPDFEAIKQGEENPQTLSAEGNALVFWGAMYGVEQGDQIRLEIVGPDGALFMERDVVQDKTRARQYYYAGRKLRNGTLEPGSYTGRLILKRGDLEKTLTRSVIVE